MEAYRNKFIATGKFAPLKHFMVGVFVLAFGLETYHHHKYHGEHHHGDEGHGDGAEAANGAAANSARERAVLGSLDGVQMEVEELREKVKAMRETMMGR